MWDIIFATTIQFFILAIPAYIVFKKLYRQPVKAKFSGTLSQEEAIEFRSFLEQLSDYLKDNNEYFGLFFTNPILYEYTRYFVEIKKSQFTFNGDSHIKSANEEYYNMREMYGDELFHSADIKMNFPSFSYNGKIHFTSHGFVHYGKWLRETGIFDYILNEMYSIVALTNGCGISSERLGELVKLFDDVRTLSSEYSIRFKPFVLEELKNLSQSVISTTSRSSSESEDENSSQHSENSTASPDGNANPSVDEQMNAILQQILAEVSTAIAYKNGDTSGLEDIMLQNSDKIKDIFRATSISHPVASDKDDSNNPSTSNVASTINNPELAKEVEQLDTILNDSNATESESSGIFSSLYALFSGGSSYLKEDFGSVN